MTVTQQRPANRYLDRPAPSSLADVIDTILDKGIVIDVYLRVSLVGIELLTIDARIVIASVDTYLRFAQAVSRMDLTQTETHGIPELMEDITSSGAKGKTSGAIEGAKEKLSDIFSDDDEEEQGQQHQQHQQQRQPRQQGSSSQKQSGQSGSSGGDKSKGS